MCPEALFGRSSLSKSNGLVSIFAVLNVCLRSGSFIKLSLQGVRAMCAKKALFPCVLLCIWNIMSGIGPAFAEASVERMMAVCRNRAHEILRTRIPEIETKYEGQRVDGTHAVNGTAYIRGKGETFQCSFDRSGRRIVRFVVNN